VIQPIKNSLIAVCSVCRPYTLLIVMI